MEHQESYLKTVFGFLGMTDVRIVRIVRIVRAERLAMGEAAKAAALAVAALDIQTYNTAANEPKAALAA